MIDDLQRRAHEIFLAAIDEEPDERPMLVTHACAGNDALRTAVDRLLCALEDTAHFLETPALGAPPSHRAAPEPLAPDAIPGYRVLGVLGVGGMATVYEAEQQKPRRRVALKVMHRSLTHTSSIHRFHFEAEVLARLRHPNIAQVYEVGVFTDSTGRSSPYFAMEFIDNARPITEAARADAIPLRDRMRMFAEVCDAVQHGHQVGVIHRDLKPSNILVDHRGAPKIIDFGVARSVLSDSERITTISDRGQILGTLNSMSPEQCAGADRVDTRSDVYSLGVVLYELLTGRPPYDLSGKSIPEAIAAIQAHDPPRPGVINPEARGDAEAIVLMAMDKDPKRRYQGADALAADIRRFLAFKTIQASLPTPWRRAALFARRHKVVAGAIALSAATLLISSALIAAFGYSSWRESLRRAEAERVALAERDTALRQTYAASLASAFLAYRANEFSQARQHLDRAPLSHRGWEWDLVNAFADTGEIVVEAHDDQVLDMALGASARRIATVSRDGTAAIWDADGGQRIARLALDSIPLSVAITDDARAVYIGCEDGSVREWNPGADPPARVIAAHAAGVHRVSLANNGLLAATSLDGVASLRHVGAPERSRVVPGLPGGVEHAVFFPDPARLLVAGRAGDLLVLRTDSLEPELTLSLGARIEAIAIAADGRTLAAGGGEGHIRVWDADTGETLAEDPGVYDISTVRSLALTPDGSSIFIGRVNRTMAEWRMASSQSRRYMLTGHDEAVASLAYDALAHQVVSASWDRTLRLWPLTELTAPGAMMNLPRARDHLLAVAFSPGGDMLASSGRDSVIQVFEPLTARSLASLRGHTDAVYDISFSPDGTIIASSSLDATVRLWSARNAEPLATLEGPGGPVWTIAFSPTGDRLFAAGSAGVVASWDLPSMTPSRSFRAHDDRIIKLVVSPDGATLATCVRDGTVALWDARSGALLHTLTGHRSDVFGAVFSRDGARLYTGSRDQTIRVWDVATGESLHTLSCRGHFITSLDITPDGARLAAGSWYGEIMLWDLSTHERVLSFAWSSLAIRDMAFSPRDKFLVTAGHAGALMRFNAAPHADRYAAHSRALAAWDDANSKAADSALPPRAAPEEIDAFIDQRAGSEDERRWLRLAVLRRLALDAAQR